MKMPLAKKDTNPFAPDATVRATRTFAWEGGVVHQGERYRGNHPAVEHGFSNFVPGETLDSELENVWGSLPDPPVHDSHVNVPASVPPWRQVVAIADTFVPVPFAPGSVGETTKGPMPPAPFGTGIKKGRVYDIADPVVRRSPQLFEFPRRDVTLADIERLERLEEHDSA